MHLYAILSTLSGFNEDNFELYLDDILLAKTPSPLTSQGIRNGDILLLRIIRPEDEYLDEGIKQKATLPKSLSADNLRLRRKRVEKIMPHHISTPRRSARPTKAESFHLLAPNQQKIIKESFYMDIIHDEQLCIVLEGKYPELIEMMFSNVENFYESLTPELMVEIDAIQESLENITSSSSSEDNSTTLPKISAEEVLHTEALINGVSIPVVFDCLSIDTSSTFTPPFIEQIFKFSEYFGL